MAIYRQATEYRRSTIQYNSLDILLRFKRLLHVRLKSFSVQSFPLIPIVATELLNLLLYKPMRFKPMQYSRHFTNFCTAFLCKNSHFIYFAYVFGLYLRNQILRKILQQLKMNALAFVRALHVIQSKYARSSAS